MAVAVMIKRKVKPGDQARKLIPLILQLRALATYQPGYISGETLICAENTNKVVVISKWETLEHWNNWKTNEKRAKIDAMLNKLQENPTIYEPYVFSKYKVAADQGFPLPIVQHPDGREVGLISVDPELIMIGNQHGLKQNPVLFGLLFRCVVDGVRGMEEFQGG